MRATKNLSKARQVSTKAAAGKIFAESVSSCSVSELTPVFFGGRTFCREGEKLKRQIVETAYCHKGQLAKRQIAKRQIVDRHVDEEKKYH